MCWWPNKEHRTNQFYNSNYMNAYSSLWVNSIPFGPLSLICLAILCGSGQKDSVFFLIIHFEHMYFSWFSHFDTCRSQLLSMIKEIRTTKESSMVSKINWLRFNNCFLKFLFTYSSDNGLLIEFPISFESFLSELFLPSGFK